MFSLFIKQVSTETLLFFPKLANLKICFLVEANQFHVEVANLIFLLLTILLQLTNFKLVFLIVAEVMALEVLQLQMILVLQLADLHILQML
jgi:hypothetical protein